METIGIIGLGWLGEALAIDLMQSGYRVQGTVTSTEKAEKIRNSGLEAQIFRLGENLPIPILNSTTCIITIPPRSHDYLERLGHLTGQLPKNAKVIYISSTSVYPDNNFSVAEEDAISRVSPHTGLSMLDTENVISKNHHSVSIVRMAGLYGPRREPGRFLANKVNVKGADNPVNLVHLVDCIGIIKAVINIGAWNEAFNACADKHPTRSEFYTKAAMAIGLKAPQFSDEKTPYKIVDNSKSKSVLDYRYQYPDPIASLESI